jgi:hypothetical protein
VAKLAGLPRAVGVGRKLSKPPGGLRKFDVNDVVLPSSVESGTYFCQQSIPGY